MARQQAGWRHISAWLAFALACSAGAAAAQGSNTAMLRISCEGGSSRAEITINNKFKGECPVDIAVEEGQLRLRAYKNVSETHEALFEDSFRIAAGTVKRVEVVLGEPQLTAKGRLVQEEQQRRALAEQQRQQIEQQRLAQLKQQADREAAQRAETEARAVANARIEPLLALLRQRSGNQIAGCPDCPVPINLVAKPNYDVPATQDATLAAWQQQALQLAREYAGNQAAFRPPANQLPLPCESASLAMRSLAQALNVEEMPNDQQVTYRAAWSKTGAGSVNLIRDVKLWPITAVCNAQGQLDGPLDFWLYSLTVTKINTMVMAKPKLQHLHATMQGGKPVGLVTKQSLDGESLTHMEGNTAVQEMNNPLTKSRTYIWSANIGNADHVTDPRNLYLHFMPSENKLLEGKNLMYTMYTLPAAGGRARITTFEGLRRASDWGTKDGKMHGTFTMYAYAVPVGLLIPDLQVPGSVMCYRMGEKISDAACPAE